MLLDREWRHLSDNRSAARRLPDICTLAGGARTLGDLERHVRTASPEDADLVLLALVRRVVEDDDALAARVLLQLLLPGTRNLARRWWALGDHNERAAAAVSAVYNRIRTYPLARRPVVEAVSPARSTRAVRIDGNACGASAIRAMQQRQCQHSSC